VKRGLQTEGRANGLARRLHLETNKGCENGRLTCKRRGAEVSFESIYRIPGTWTFTSWYRMFAVTGTGLHPLLLMPGCLNTPPQGVDPYTAMKNVKRLCGVTMQMAF
jgi:hypothetical protein